MRYFTAFLIYLLSSLPGLAHSPYFSDWSCQSEDGYSLRLFYGDGIVGPDPASVVALDPEGHLLAIQPVGTGSYPLAGATCQIADPEMGAIWHAVPEDFFVGIKIFGDTEQLRKARWQYEPGVVRKKIGFEKSPLSDVSFLAIISAEITSNITTAVILAISSFAILVSLAALVRRVTYDGTVPKRILFGVLWLVPLPVFALLSLVVVLFDAPSIQLIALSASIGGVLAVALILFYSRSRRRSID